MTFTVTKCTKEKLVLPPCKGRIIEAEFVEKEVTSDGGVLLLREIDRKINLIGELEKIIPDPREPAKIKHSLISMLKQRIYGIALGYEDLNDHATLRDDPALQTAVDRVNTLSSNPTLCRMENRANRKMIFDSNKLMVEKFIESFVEPPSEIVLDFDATEDEVHGHQENRHFHGYYECYCFFAFTCFL